jgi:glycosyltransferase involved in cell wall biosynthesis
MRTAAVTRLVCIGHANLAPLGASLRMLNPRIRYQVATHGIEVWQPLPKLRALALRHADTVTSVSRFTREQVTRLQGVDASKAVVLPWALDPEFLASSRERATVLRNGKSNYTILTVSRLSKGDRYKGIDTVIRALPRVIEQVPRALHVVVGDGDDRSRLEQLADTTGVSEHVLFLGKTTDQGLVNAYRDCDVFAMPSVGEGFGLVFLEAMAFGKPVIGGNFGGIPDLINDGVNGFLIKRDDVHTLANRITRLLRSPDLSAGMGEAGRKIVAEKYTFDRFVRGFENVLTG